MMNLIKKTNGTRHHVAAIALIVLPALLMGAAIMFVRIAAPASAAHGQPTAGHGASGMGVGEAMGRLVEGNSRFVAGASVPADIGPARLKELTKGQTPYAVVLTCADSRVAPEHIFNAGLGELFVIRVAGNVANSDAIASTEYAVAHLGARLVVVLGHDACGAVKAAAAGAKDTPAIETLVAQIVPAVEVAKDEGHKDDKLIDRAIIVNAQKARERMINQSALLKDLVRKGELKITVAKYQLADGKLVWLNTDGLTTAPTAENTPHKAGDNPPAAAEAHSTHEPAKTEPAPVRHEPAKTETHAEAPTKH